MNVSARMTASSLTVFAGLWFGLLIGVAPAAAQSVYPGGAWAPANGSYGPPPRGRGRLHIVVTPRPLLYRRCTEQLQLQYRPSGPVLYPLTYCWWVRG
jgi:hypothetical protein